MMQNEDFVVPFSKEDARPVHRTVTWIGALLLSKPSLRRNPAAARYSPGCIAEGHSKVSVLVSPGCAKWRGDSFIKRRQAVAKRMVFENSRMGGGQRAELHTPTQPYITRKSPPQREYG